MVQFRALSNWKKWTSLNNFGKAMSEFHVYIMSNSSRILYIGMTNNLELRVWQHKAKQIEGFTRRYNLTMLVYSEQFSNPGDAIAREKELKGWLRQRKIELIEAQNPQWLDLSADWFR